MINVQIEKSWFTQLSSEFEKDYKLYQNFILE